MSVQYHILDKKLELIAPPETVTRKITLILAASPIGTYVLRDRGNVSGGRTQYETLPLNTGGFTNLVIRSVWSTNRWVINGSHSGGSLITRVSSIADVVTPDRADWSADASITSVSGEDGGDLATFLGQRAIVRTSNSGNDFEDIWTCTDVTNQIWSPPDHILLDRTTGLYHRHFWDNGVPLYELAYP